MTQVFLFSGVTTFYFLSADFKSVRMPRSTATDSWLVKVYPHCVLQILEASIEICIAFGGKRITLKCKNCIGCPPQFSKHDDNLYEQVQIKPSNNKKNFYAFEHVCPICTHNLFFNRHFACTFP